MLIVLETVKFQKVPFLFQVCEAIPFQFHHYGAFVCNRCRAFFRRMVRRRRKGAKVGKCLGNNALRRSMIEIPDVVPERPVCDISVFRGACPPCRFSRCLNVGMKPALVLSDDVRKEKYVSTHGSPK